MTADAASLSRRLLEAERSGEPIAPFDPSEGGGVDDAYAVQAMSVRAWIAQGRRLVGRKVGLTNPKVQVQLGVDRPDFGVLFDDMRFDSGDVVPTGRVLQPRIEAEMAFVLSGDLTDPDMTVEDVAAAVAGVRPSLEIVGSRIRDWKITIFDTIADNASSGAFVIGERTVPLADVDLQGASMCMVRTRDGEEQVVSEGVGADCLGSPLLAARWLAVELARRGDPLHAGDIVLTGALGPMVPVQPGDVFEATIAGLGSVTITFA